MRYTTLLILAAFLAGCASSPTADKNPSKATESVSAARETAPVSGNRNDVYEESKVETSKPASPAKADNYASLRQELKTKRDDRVVPLASEVLSQNSNDVKVLNALAMHHYEMGRIGLAKTILNRAMTVANSRSDRAAIYNNFGLIELSEDNVKAAIIQFNRALDQESDNYEANANLGSLYIRYEAFGKALSYLKKAYQKNSHDYRLANNYAIALRDTKNYTSAQEIYKNLLSDQGSNPTILLNYSILLIDYMNQYQEGLDLLNRLRFVGPDNDVLNKINALEKKAKAGLK